MGVSILPTRDYKETALAIKRMAIREQSNKESHIMARSAPKGMSLEERKRFILEGLFDTGPKLATLLVEKFGTPLRVLLAIKKTELIYTRTGNPKGIEGPLSELKGIGFKWVEKNKELLKAQ